MKKQILFLICAALFITTGSYAQTAKELRQQEKAEKARDKDLVSQIKKNPTRDAKKEAKALEKEGFKAAAGALPLGKQIDKAWKFQYEVDSEGYPLYFIATSTAVGGNYSAAKLQATSLAKSDIAGQISTQVAEIIKNEVSNDMISEDEAMSMTSSASAAKQKIAQTLGRTISVVEISRTLPNKNTEVRITLAYNYLKGRALAENAVKELKAKTNEIAEEVNSML